MAITSEQSLILQKIVSLIRKLQEYLAQVGLSVKETSLFFQLRIFDCVSIEDGERVPNSIQCLIKRYLQQGEKKHGSLRNALVHILTKLEIENGCIEEYEDFQPQPLSCQPADKLLCNETLKLEPPFRSRKLFSRDLQQDSYQVISQLTQIKNFERELQESLMKTKLLKRLIQQKLMSEVDEANPLRMTNFRSLLLQSS